MRRYERTQGKEKVDKLTNLIGIFESKGLDFSKHRADGDDILGDAYEYSLEILPDRYGAIVCDEGQDFARNSGFRSNCC